MQTLSFRPTTTASGVTPRVQKGSLDLQPSTHKARPSGATVQQQASKPAQVAVNTYLYDLLLCLLLPLSSSPFFFPFFFFCCCR